ncbi:MAG TPA: GxxExxY protein [Tepidisphaeraceae bacterium]|jgi:GxxExxY protein|nr:GxxExxY protein [Tepidisphaeraceae bacterium]
MDTDEEHLNAVTQLIIGCAFKVHNSLGSGFSEKVYANALTLELRKAGLKVEREMRIVVRYDGVVVGEYFADIVVEGFILVETKAVRNFDDGHTAQCLNYLAATGFPLCLLLKFGRKVEVKRLRK